MRRLGISFKFSLKKNYLWLAGDENSSIFAPALRHNEGCGVEREVHYILGYGVFFKAIKLKKIKVKKLIFLLARIKRGCIFAAAKTAKVFNKNGSCFEVLLRLESFKKKSKIFLKKIWRIKKKHCIFAAAYGATEFPKILKRNPGWVIR